MKALLGMGKLLAALFWGALLANLLDPFVQPFALLLNLAGAAVLLIHAAELLLFRPQLKQCSRPLLQAGQVMLFGIFHLLALPPAQAEAAESLVAEQA
jgi:putative membrane protein